MLDLRFITKSQLKPTAGKGRNKSKFDSENNILSTDEEDKMFEVDEKEPYSTRYLKDQ